jgi:curli production assembly/transport component CsgF
MSKVILFGAVVGALMVIASSTRAQQLVYTPINPAFGGNPFNATQLEADASAQNQYKSTGAPKNLTDAQLFAQQLQSELLAGLANQVAQAIFGPNAQPSGTFSFGGETVTFVRSLGEITVNITDASGATTVITLPTAGGSSSSSAGG